MLAPRTESALFSSSAWLEISENSRLGFGRNNAAPHLAQQLCNSTTALEIERDLPRNRGGSRVQTWNRYVYVANNPNSYIDPFGLKIVPCPAGTPEGTICVDDPQPGNDGGGGESGGGSTGGGDWVLLPGCIQFSGSPAVGCDHGPWRNIDDLLNRVRNFKVTPLKPQQPPATANPPNGSQSQNDQQQPTEVYPPMAQQLFQGNAQTWNNANGAGNTIGWATVGFVIGYGVPAAVPVANTMANTVNTGWVAADAATGGWLTRQFTNVSWRAGAPGIFGQTLSWGYKQCQRYGPC